MAESAHSGISGEKERRERRRRRKVEEEVSEWKTNVDVVVFGWGIPFPVCFGCSANPGIVARSKRPHGH